MYTVYLKELTELQAVPVLSFEQRLQAVRAARRLLQSVVFTQHLRESPICPLAFTLLEVHERELRKCIGVMVSELAESEQCSRNCYAAVERTKGGGS